MVSTRFFRSVSGSLLSILLMFGVAEARTTHAHKTSVPATTKKSASKSPAKSASRKSTVAASTKGKKSSRTAVAAKPCKKGKHCKATYAAAKPKARGQQVIDPDRAREIQAALIRENYLDGEPSGEWDQRTREALVKFQGDNGWQTKVVPDSRALIKLGLGPSRDGLLNPESAAITAPHELGRAEVPGGSMPNKN